MLRVRLVRVEDAKRLAVKLREADLQEIQAVSGKPPLDELIKGIGGSKPCYSIVDSDDEPTAIFGVAPDPAKPSTEKVGLVWLLASDELAQHSMLFLRESRYWVEKLHESYDVLWNHVDARNTAHLSWLKWCGFSLLELQPKYGVEQRPFYRFAKQKVR